MTRFQPKNPQFRTIATDTFNQQRAMKTLGISIARLEPGEVDLAMDYSPDLTQQHGFTTPGSSPPASTMPAASPPSR
jgi:acyl-coenzyme A thioesterase PaaI-like protein